MGFSFKSRFGSTTTETVPGLKGMFKNTPLEPYCERLMQFFFSERIRMKESDCKKDVQEDVEEYLRSLTELVNMLLALKSHKINGDTWQLTNDEVCKELYDEVEEIFLKRLEKYDDVLYDSYYDEMIGVDIDALFQKLADFPTREGFEFEEREVDENGKEVEYGWKHLSKSELESTAELLKSYEEPVRAFHTAVKDSTSVRFIKFALNAGVPHTRKIYRELYKFMDCFFCIPDDVKASHSKTISTKDPESNYVKAIVSRVLSAEKQKPTESA